MACNKRESCLTYFNLAEKQRDYCNLTRGEECPTNREPKITLDEEIIRDIQD